MKTTMLVLLALAISGCAYYTAAPVEDDARTREARAQCKALARTLVQIARCDNR